MKYLLTILTISFYITCYSQNSKTLTVHVKNLPIKKIWFLFAKGDKHQIIDSMYSKKDGRIDIKLNPSLEKGLYRLVLDADKSMEIIVSNEDIEIKSEIFNLIDSTTVLSSKENIMYYNHLKFEKKISEKMKRLDDLTIDFDPKSDFIKTPVTKKYSEYILQKEKYYQSLIAQNSNLYAKNLILAKRTIDVLPSLNNEERTNYLKIHYFDYIDITNETYLTSDVFSDKIFQLLNLYSNSHFTFEEQENAYIEACKNILPKVKNNKALFDFTMEFLVRGFEYFRFEKTLQYLATEYKPENSCENNERKTSFQKKMESRTTQQIGYLVPNIIYKTSKDSLFNLYESNKQNTIIVFYSSWCSHCKNDIPNLNYWYSKFENKNNLNIVAISLDENLFDWKNFIIGNNLDFIHMSELNGWKGKIVDDFNVYATPTFFVLDTQKKLLLKSNESKEVIEYFKK